MTHIKEAWERTRDNTQAVIDGVGHTGRVITSAALIMVSVFFALHHQWRPDRQAVRRRYGRRGRRRCDARAMPARAGRDDARSVARTGGSRAGWTGSSRTSRSRATSGSASATRRSLRRPASAAEPEPEANDAGLGGRLPCRSGGSFPPRCRSRALAVLCDVGAGLGAGLVDASYRDAVPGRHLRGGRTARPCNCSATAPCRR